MKRPRGRPRKVKPEPEAKQPTPQGSRNHIGERILALCRRAEEGHAIEPVTWKPRSRTTVRGRPRTRIDTARAAADAVARLTRKGKSAREVRQQVAQELGRRTALTAEYVRQQVNWYDRHVPEIFADDWYDAARGRQLEEEHEQALMKDVAD